MDANLVFQQMSDEDLARAYDEYIRWIYEEGTLRHDSLLRESWQKTSLTNITGIIEPLLHETVIRQRKELDGQRKTLADIYKYGKNADIGAMKTFASWAKQHLKETDINDN